MASKMLTGFPSNRKINTVSIFFLIFFLNFPLPLSANQQLINYFKHPPNNGSVSKPQIAICIGGSRIATQQAFYMIEYFERINYSIPSPVEKFFIYRSDVDQCCRKSLERSGLRMVPSDWPVLYEDPRLVKIEIFTNPVFRRYDYVIWIDADTLMNQTSLMLTGASSLITENESESRRDDTQIMVYVHFSPRKTLLNPAKMNSTELEEATRRGYFDRLSIQSSTFVVLPKNLPKETEMQHKWKYIIERYHAVAYHGDQGLLPVVFPPENLKNITTLPFLWDNGLHLYNGRIVFPILKRLENLMRNPTVFCWRKLMSEALVKALKKLEHYPPCLGISKVIRCHEEFLSISENIEITQTSFENAANITQKHIRCLHLYDFGEL